MSIRMAAVSFLTGDSYKRQYNNVSNKIRQGMNAISNHGSTFANYPGNDFSNCKYEINKKSNKSYSIDLLYPVAILIHPYVYEM